MKNIVEVKGTECQYDDAYDGYLCKACDEELCGKYKGDYDSPANQRIKDKLVNRDIICNLSILIDKIQELDPDHDILFEMENYRANKEDEYPEIFEYWAVSSYFAEKLEEKGECIVMNWYGLNVWGRQATGQAILLDNIISEIAEDMEILEGQTNEWDI